MKFFSIIMACLFLLFLSVPGVAKGGRHHVKKRSVKTDIINQETRALIAESKKNAELSMNSVMPRKKIDYSRKGINIASHCVSKFPKEAGCYFYKAVNTGLHIETASAGYKSQLLQLVKDCEKVIALNDKFDGGGAYRILGNIYLKVPSFSSSKGAIIKDVDKAYDYAQRALAINESDAENRLLMGEVFYEMEKWSEAKKYLHEAVRELPQKEPYTWHDKKTVKKAKELLKKAEKQLTKKG